MKRRSNAEIEAVRELGYKTSGIASAILARVDPNDETAISVSAASWWDSKAEYQLGVADTIVVSFRTKDPAEAERVAQAMRAALGSSSNTPQVSGTKGASE